MSVTNSQMRTRFLDYVERKKKEVFKLCSDLIQIPSENPPGDTTEIAKFLRDFLERNGVSVREYEPKKGSPNVLGRIGQGDERNIVFSGHMDVLPAGKGWDDPPFSGRISGGKILGRGACDMKTGLTAALTTLLAASKFEKDLAGRFTICLVSDEETGGNWGTKWMVDNVPEASGTACIIGEPGGIDVVPIGEKGIFWIRLKASGQAAHGAYDVLGDNAILTMCRALPEVVKMRNVKGRIPRDLVSLIDEERPYVEDRYGKGVGDVLTRVSVSPGVIAGGEALNMVAENCGAEVDMRLPIGVSTKKAQKLLRGLLLDANLTNVKPEVMVMSDPNYTSPEQAFVEVVRSNVRRVIRKEPKLIIKLGATDGRYYRLGGVPTVTYGPGIYNMSRANEYVPLEELLTISKVYGGVVSDYLGQG